MNTRKIPWNDNFMRAERLGAMRCDFSLFEDGYDLKAEESMLRAAGVLDSDDLVHPGHPLFPRLAEFERRSEAIEKAQKEHAYRDGADPLLTTPEARAIRDIGRLTSDGDDELMVHTRDAYRLFMGRIPSPGESNIPGIVAGRKAAAALLILWNLSGQDNPYADWLLMRFTEQIAEFRRKLKQGTDRLTKQMEEDAKKGLRIRLVLSVKPISLQLGFRSPYGYEIAYLISEFDWAVRHIRTMAMKAKITSQHEQDLLTSMRREARRIFEDITRGQRILSYPQLQGLTRADWLPQVDEQAKLRVKAVIELLGELPREVFNLSKLPKHHKVHMQLTPAELKLLDELPLNGVASDAVEVGPDEQEAALV